MAVTSLSLERPDGQTRQIMAHDDGDYRALGLQRYEPQRLLYRADRFTTGPRRNALP